jgi:hypothetical protein
VAAALPQASQPLGTLRHRSAILLACAAGLVLRGMLRSNHIVKRLWDTAFGSVAVALLPNEVAPSLGAAFVANVLLDSAPDNPRRNTLCKMLQEAGVVKVLVTWLGPYEGLLGGPEPAVVLQALKGMSKMTDFDRDGDSFDLRAPCRRSSCMR